MPVKSDGRQAAVPAAKAQQKAATLRGDVPGRSNFARKSFHPFRTINNLALINTKTRTKTTLEREKGSGAVC